MQFYFWKASVQATYQQQQKNSDGAISAEQQALTS
jgi:hypothetical protein